MSRPVGDVIARTMKHLSEIKNLSSSLTYSDTELNIMEQHAIRLVILHEVKLGNVRETIANVNQA